MAEQRTFNPKRVGSSPTGPTSHRVAQANGASDNPVAVAIFETEAITWMKPPSLQHT